MKKPYVFPEVLRDQVKHLLGGNKGWRQESGLHVRIDGFTTTIDSGPVAVITKKLKTIGFEFICEETLGGCRQVFYDHVTHDHYATLVVSKNNVRQPFITVTHEKRGGNNTKH